MLGNISNMNGELFDLSRVLAVCAGNPGAITVMAEVHNEFPERVDAILAALEMFQIRGSDIWVIYKRHCAHNVRQFVEFPFQTYVKDT